MDIVSKALQNNAAQVAMIRLYVESGDLPKYNLATALPEAVKHFESLKRQGKSVDLYLQEQALFSEYEDSVGTREIERGTYEEGFLLSTLMDIAEGLILLFE